MDSTKLGLMTPGFLPVEVEPRPPKLLDLEQDILNKIFSFVGKTSLITSESSAKTLKNRVDAFKLSLFEKEIRAAISISSEFSIRYELQRIFTPLLQSKSIESVIHMIMQLPSSIDKILILKTLFSILKRGNAVVSAIKVAMALPPSDLCRELLIYSDELCMKADISHGIEAVLSIPMKVAKESALRQIFDRLFVRFGRSDINAENIAKAIETALLIPNEYYKGFSLYSICEKLSNEGYLDNAIEVANLISSDSTFKRAALLHLSTLKRKRASAGIP
ncbi:MAG: hypothetical protein FJZ59_07615 [Chlamydiae bacterium]|nr:hypothetical protein [Chlamydiota bacterium]